MTLEIYIDEICYLEWKGNQEKIVASARKNLTEGKNAVVVSF